MILNFYKRDCKICFLFLFSLFFCLTLFSVISFAAENFPTYGANFERTGFVDTGFSVDLTVPEAGEGVPISDGWNSVSFEGAIESTPVVVNNKIYFTTAPFLNGTPEKSMGLYCYSLLNYTSYSGPVQEWFLPLEVGSFSTPTYHDGFIYVGCGYGVLYCVNATTGIIEWQTNVLDSTETYGLSASPVVLNGTVYVSTKTPARFIGFNAKDGTQILDLNFETSVALMASSCSGDGVLYTPGENGVVAVSDNSVLWNYPLSGEVGTPVYHKGNLYIETSEYLYSIKTNPNLSEDSRLNWKIPRSGHVSTPAVSDKYVVSIHKDGISAYDVDNGTHVWTNEPINSYEYRFSKNSPLIDGSTVYYTQNYFKRVGDLYGFVCSADLSTGKNETIKSLGNENEFNNFKINEEWKKGTGCPITHSSPVSVDGKLLVGSGFGTIENKFMRLTNRLFLLGSHKSKITIQGNENISLVPGNKINVSISVPSETTEVDHLSLLGLIKQMSLDKSSYTHKISKSSLGKYTLSEFYGLSANESSKWTIYINNVSIGSDFTNQLLKSKDVVDFVYNAEYFDTKISATVHADYTLHYKEIPLDEIRLIKDHARFFSIYARDPFGKNITLNKSDIMISVPENSILKELTQISFDNNLSVWSVTGKNEGRVIGSVKYAKDGSVVCERPIILNVFSKGSIPSDPSIEETGDDFFTSRGNYARTGVAKGAGPLVPGLLWSHEFVESGFPTLVDGHPVVSNGVVFETTWLSGTYPNGTSINGLYSFDKDTGEYIDRYDASSRTGMTIYEGRIYAPAGDGIVCLDEKTGQKYWGTGTIVSYPWAGLTSIPLVYDNVVYVCTNGKSRTGFMGFDATTGKELFSLDAGRGVAWFVAPSMSPGNDTYPPVVYSPGDGGVFAFDTVSRQKIWSFDAGARGAPDTGGNGQYVTTPVYFKEHIYLIQTGGSIYCLNAITGEVVWETKFKAEGACPIVTDDKVYVLGKGIAAFSRKTGEHLWGDESNLSSPVASPVLAGDIIYLPTTAYSAHTGEKLWQYVLPTIHPEQNWLSITQGTPAVQDGILYFGCENNIFYALATPKYVVNYDLQVDNEIINPGSAMVEGDSVELAYFADKANGTIVKDWYDSETDIRVGSPGDTFTPVKNLTLYPHYAKAVNITYCPDGELINYLGFTYTPKQDPLFPGDKFTVVPYFPKGNGHFAGWTDGQDIYIPNETYTVPNRDLGLSPIWKNDGNVVRYEFSKQSLFLGKQVFFQAGSMAPGAQFKILGEDDFPIADPEFGSVFAGWSDGNKTYQPGEIYTMGNSRVIFRALWTETPSDISYDLNGGLYNNKTTVPKQDPVASGMFFKLLPNAPAKPGFLFEGWSDGLSDHLYQPGEKYNVGDSDVVMKAQWKPGVTVKFDPRGGRVSLLFVVGSVGENVVLPTSVNTYKKEGVFIGWALNPNAGHDSVLSEFVFPDNDVTLYAIWEGGIDEPTEEPEPSETTHPAPTETKYYTVTYLLSGGSGSDGPTQMPLLSGTVFSVKAMPNGAKLDGFEFSGWLHEGSGKIYYPGDRFLVGNDNVVLSAVWIPKETSEAPDFPFRFVTFVDDKGNLIAKKAVEPGSPIPSVSSVPLKTGFVFRGWLLNGSSVSDGHPVYTNITLVGDYMPLPVLSGTSDKASILDVMILLQYTSGVGALKDVSESDMVEIADLNGDKVIDIVDVILFLKAI